VLRWSLPEAVKRSGVSVNTISRFENGGSGIMDTAIKLRNAYESAGISFPDAESVRFDEHDPPTD
jgi:transcriptional regulator with XRE-family HTH domain